MLKCLVLARGSNKSIIQDYIIPTILLLSLCAKSSCQADKTTCEFLFLFGLLTIFSADVAYAALSDLLYTVSLLRGWIIRIKIEHINSFCPTHLFGSVLNMR